MKLHILTVIVTLIALGECFCQASPGYDQNLRTNVVSNRGKRNLKTKVSNTKSSKSLKSSKASQAERAVTMWWVLFNKPSECTSNPEGPVFCGIADVMGNAGANTNKPDISIIHASGGISDKMGNLRMVAALYKTGTCDLDLGDATGSGEHYTFGGPPILYTLKGSSKGYCPAEGEETEVHIVLRDHGLVTEDKLWQITRFTDPSCSQNGGPNLCVDNGAVGFPPMSENGMMTKDIGNFPMFPPGCFEAGECEEDVEKVQLSGGMGNEVTLVKTGDTIQVVAEVKVPKV